MFHESYPYWYKFYDEKRTSDAVSRANEEQRNGGDSKTGSKIQNAITMAAIAMPRSKRIHISSSNEVRERRDRKSRQSHYRYLITHRSGSDLNKLAPRLRNFPLRMAQSSALLWPLV